MALYSVPYLAPLVLLAAALACARLPGKRPGSVAGVPLLHLTEGAAIAAMLIAVFSGLILGLAGPGTSPLLGLAGFGFSARLDMLSLIMLALVSFVGWVVLRYARTYLDGEEGQGAFTGLICAALAAVMLLVLAGNLVQLVLAWMATGALLIQLLLFYRQRIAARRAARKKALMSIGGSLFLLVAVFMLGAAFGTGDMASILAAAREGASIPELAAWAALPLALAAILKSAQFPIHGWLSEVMEAPTPVSALLHAGVINAGGFLLIRFADVMLLSPGVLALLVMVGGFTALFGGMVMLTQSAVKTSLAWSTVAQMGFMILQCGLALFPLALLHIVAHSLYKAHAFLASGSAVASVSAIRRPGPVAVPGPGAVLRAFLLALAIYAVVAFAFGLDGKSPQTIALGAILIFGIAYLLAQGLAEAAPWALTRRIAVYSLASTLGYFALQTGADWLMAGTLPATPAPGPLEWALIVLAVLSFALVAVAQAMFPLWAYHPAAAGLRVHLSNGLYANALLDRMLGAWTAKTRS